MICIYKITNPKGKVYIGQTVEFNKRKWAYANGQNKAQKKVYNSINKYGWDAHAIEVIEECSVELLNERERYWQDFYNVLGANGLNCRLTKSNDKSGYFSEETKKKMSIAAKLMPEKISNLIEKRHDWTGKKHKPETRERMRLAALGKKKTAEHISKLPQNQKGKIQPKPSEEVKQKIFDSMPTKKQIQQISLSGEVVNTFLSSNHAAKSIGLNKGGNIRSCAIGKLRTAYGFIWKYID